MFHKVASAEPGMDCALNVLFLDGTRKEYNVRRLFDRYPVFRQLAEDETLFRQVKVDPCGYGVSWNDELDLSCDELYDHGRRTDDRTPIFSEEELCRRFDNGMKEVRAGRGVVISLDELKANAAHIAAEP